MPRIDWRTLPRNAREHLEDRLRTRQGPWCKDFGTFTLAGEGKYPKMFLSKEQPCHGERI
jgi:hypothetical protein